MSTTAQLDTDINDTPTECGLPPPGWKCTRKAGHDGPCAAVKYHVMTSDKPWIGVDLDATLAHYDDWRGIDHIGAPIPAMQTRVKQWLAEGKHVRILTARVGPQRHDVPHTIAEITHHIEQWCLQHLGQVLPVTASKDYNMVAFYDDRCMQVIPNDGTCVVDDFNQRLIDRTTGFMQTLGQQALEIAELKRELRAQEGVMQNYRVNVSSALDLANAPTHHPATEAPHRKPMMPNERIIALAVERDAAKEQIERMIKHHQYSMETDSIVASCGCITKTNDPQHHKPGCKYRLISERDEFRKIVFDSHREAHALAIAIHRNYYMDAAPHWEPLPDVPGLISQLDNMYAGVRGKHEEALHALRQAYVHNQNMHCFATKGRLNDQLNEQTHLLRKALNIPGAQPPEAAPVPYAAEKAAFAAGRKIEYTRLCVDNGCESWASWWAPVTDTPPDWNNKRLRFRIADEATTDPA